jgi:hypothetical protein
VLKGFAKSWVPIDAVKLGIRQVEKAKKRQGFFASAAKLNIAKV